jgi:hypothetical protein
MEYWICCIRWQRKNKVINGIKVANPPSLKHTDCPSGSSGDWNVIISIFKCRREKQRIVPD